MAREKTADECPMDHKCAYEMIASMQQAKRDIDELKSDLEEARKELKSELKETKDMVSDIHESVLKFGSGFNGFKIGIRVTVWGMIAVILGVFSIIYLFATGQISFKDLIGWLL